MALQSRVVNGSLTEIYAGGGNFVTEAFPTNFHTFAPKHILLDGQSADDYKEVTPAERSDIEAKDAKWEEWPESTIAEWNTACGSDGGYNTKTGYGELNGLTLTLSDALKILIVGRMQRLNYGQAQYAMQYQYSGTNIRTNLPDSSRYYYTTPLWVENNADLEVFHASNTQILGLRNCPKLKRILGRWCLPTANGADYKITGCPNLEHIEFYWACQRFCGKRDITLDWSECPKLDIATFQKMLDFAEGFKANGNTLTVTVHADVYAKLTDESNTDWHALMTSAAAKNITFATT